METLQLPKGGPFDFGSIFDWNHCNSLRKSSKLAFSEIWDYDVPEVLGMRLGPFDFRKVANQKRKCVKSLSQKQKKKPNTLPRTVDMLIDIPIFH